MADLKIFITLFFATLFCHLKAQEIDTFSRSITYKDSILIQKYTFLITQKPNIENWEAYFSIAKSLYNYKRNQEAKAMFVNILASKQLPYDNKIQHYASLEADSNSYGSFTSHYKNETCLFLTKIELEAKNFAQALAYLELLEKNYPIKYNCGTMTARYESELIELRALCYEGLGNIKKAIDLLFPYCFDHHNQILIRTLKRYYSSSKIKKYLSIALKSITCEVDSTLSTSYITINYGLPDETTKVITYTSGKGKIKLFGKIVEMPEPMLENREVVQREHFINHFLQSDFYAELSGDYSYRKFYYNFTEFNYQIK